MNSVSFLHDTGLEDIAYEQFAQLPGGAASKAVPCVVHVPEETITGLREQVRFAASCPVTFENTQSGNTSEYGITKAWMDQATRLWADETKFEWNKIEARMNGVPHFKQQVEYNGHMYNVHFTALFSQKPDAIPIVNIHGWPGCFLEFLPMMELLQRRYTPATLPYHLIALSMPGYTFSSGPPTDMDFTTLDTIHIFRTLLDSLLTSPYIVSGGDVGSRIARGLSVLDPYCAALHLNFSFDSPILSYARPSDPSSLDARKLSRIDDFMSTGGSYSQLQAHRPSTLSHALSASPVSLLAWLGEKYLSWSHAGSQLSTETILTFVTLYYLTGTLPRSLYPYRCDFSTDAELPKHGDEKWNVPEGKGFGFSDFENDITPVPRAWVEKTGRLGWYAAHSEGGHFAALEVPEVFLGDLKGFVGVLRDEGKL